MSNDQNAGYLLYIGDYTTQVYGDYHRPFSRSLLTNQLECHAGLFHVGHMARCQ